MSEKEGQEAFVSARIASIEGEIRLMRANPNEYVRDEHEPYRNIDDVHRKIASLEKKRDQLCNRLASPDELGKVLTPTVTKRDSDLLTAAGRNFERAVHCFPVGLPAPMPSTTEATIEDPDGGIPYDALGAIGEHMTILALQGDADPEEAAFDKQ